MGSKRRSFRDLCFSHRNTIRQPIARSSLFRTLAVQPLEDRRMLSGWSEPLDGPANLEGHLLAIWRDSRSGDVQSVDDSVKMCDMTTAETREDTQDARFSSLMFGPEGRVCVDVWTTVRPANVADDLTGLGFQLGNSSDEYHLLERFLPVTSLVAAADLPGVLSITPVYRPVTYVGTVTTQGDEIIHTNDARASGYDGTGVKAGVLSDSLNRKDGGLPDSIASGDLPGPGNPLGNTNPVEVLRDYPGTAGPAKDADEGRAVLEVTHQNFGLMRCSLTRIAR